MSKIKFTLETTDEHLARIYMDAAKMRHALTRLDFDLRAKANSEYAQYWREHLHLILNEEGVNIHD